MPKFYLALATALILAGAAAQADDQPKQSCFSMRDWQNWKADPVQKDVLYFRVRMHDVYRVQLTDPEPMLNYPSVHLVSKTRGPDMVCNPIDLDLKVSENGGGIVSVPIIVKALTRLTPEEAAALPKGAQP
jgi:hypothetical protein